MSPLLQWNTRKWEGAGLLFLAKAYFYKNVKYEILLCL